MEYFEATGSTQQEAYDNLLDQVFGTNVRSFTFGGLVLTFPTTYNSNGYIAIAKESGGSVITSNWVYVNYALTMSTITNGLATAKLYRKYDTNFYLLTPSISSSNNILLIEFENTNKDLITFLTPNVYLTTRGSTEYIYNQTSKQYIVGNSNTGISSAFVFNAQTTGLQSQNETCIAIPLIYCGAFADAPVVINDFCLLITRAYYPRETQFTYMNETWELLQTASTSYMSSYICHKITN